MSHLEYLIVLVSIVVGLGVTELARGIRELVHPRQPVRWHWQPLAWVAIVLMQVLTAWWWLFPILKRDLWQTPVTFLPVLVTCLTLYLLCTFALPDVDRPAEATFVGDGGEDSEAMPTIDLKAFYFSTSHRWWFFGTATVFVVAFFAIVQFGAIEIVDRSWRGAIDAFLFSTALHVPTYGLLIATDNRWMHGLGTLFSFIVAVYFLVGIADVLSV